jgi:dienelactone hydrolase
MQRSTRVTLAALAFALSSLATLARGDTPPAETPKPARIAETKSGVRFGLWPPEAKGPAPTLFILANSIEGTLDDAYFRQSGNQLARRGYLCVSVDLPCHGKERRADEPAELKGWRRRCERDEDFIADLVTRLRAVLDHLIDAGLADPARIAVCGTSRGGFSGLHFAAAEPRVKCVAAFAPLTDLDALTEFQGTERFPMVKKLGLGHRADDLAGRAVWIIIGDRDDRVGTDRVIQFARQVTKASLRLKRPALVELHVVAEPRGHGIPPYSPVLAAEWIDRQIHSQK